MTSEPFFSVIIPTYNRADVVVSSIRSVLSQDFQDLELIVVDDGSTDHTKEVISQIEDYRLRYFFKKNEERGAARNFGVRMAKGQYVTFLDSDDFLFNNHLLTASKFIRDNGHPAAFHLAYEIRTEEGLLITKKDLFENINREILHGNSLSCNGVFILKKTALENKFVEDRTLAGLEDWELWIRLCAKIPFLHSNVITSRIVQHNGRSVLTDRPQRIISKVETFIQYVLDNPDNRACYGRHLTIVKSGALTYCALHLSLILNCRMIAFKYFLRGIFASQKASINKRSLVIIRNILFGPR